MKDIPQSHLIASTIARCVSASAEAMAKSLLASGVSDETVVSTVAASLSGLFLDAMQRAPQSIQIADAGFSTRVRGILEDERVVDLVSLSRMTPRELVQLHNFGVQCLDEVRSILHSHGMGLSHDGVRHAGCDSPANLEIEEVLPNRSSELLRIGIETLGEAKQHIDAIYKQFHSGTVLWADIRHALRIHGLLPEDK